MSHRTLAGLIIALVASSVLAAHAVPVTYELASSTESYMSIEAQPAPVEVSLVSVDPGTPSGDGDWCIGTERVTLTAHVVDLASQSEVRWARFCGRYARVHPSMAAPRRIATGTDQRAGQER
jgi:hypothetical protein